MATKHDPTYVCQSDHTSQVSADQSAQKRQLMQQLFPVLSQCGFACTRAALHFTKDWKRLVTSGQIFIETVSEGDLSMQLV